MAIYRMKLVFTAPLLGTVSKDPAVYASYIASKSPNLDTTLDEEMATVPEGATQEEKGWTGFHTEDGKPFLYDYVIKGFCKDACSMLNRVPGTESNKLKAFRKCIDGLVFVKPRKLFFHLSGALEMKERPLRAQTAQGERVALARSDIAPVGSFIEFDLHVLGAISKKTVAEWFDYGINRGLGQWRNAGWGSFACEMTEA